MVLVICEEMTFLSFYVKRFEVYFYMTSASHRTSEPLQPLSGSCAISR